MSQRSILKGQIKKELIKRMSKKLARKDNLPPGTFQHVPTDSSHPVLENDAYYTSSGHTTLHSHSNQSPNVALDGGEEGGDIDDGLITPMTLKRISRVQRGIRRAYGNHGGDLERVANAAGLVDIEIQPVRGDEYDIITYTWDMNPALWKRLMTNFMDKLKRDKFEVEHNATSRYLPVDIYLENEDDYDNRKQDGSLEHPIIQAVTRDPRVVTSLFVWKE